LSETAVADHGLISDCSSAALVTSDGSVDWLCFPRFDSPSLLGRLLDNRAGHFSIAPVGADFPSLRRYRPLGLVLDTTWHTSTGTLVLSDALALGHHERGHDLGRNSPGVLLREVHCTKGAVAVHVEYAPRPEYGLVHPRLTSVPGAIVATGGATTAVLSTTCAMDLAEATATATIDLKKGEHLGFALTQASAWEHSPEPWSSNKIRRRLRDTERGWRTWSELHQRYEGPHRDLVHHSGVVLQGLTYARSGAIVAAATTSLPEGVGTSRTWDYRYTWVRDASMTMQGLWIAACPDEAGRFFSFLATAASTQLTRGVDLQIMYGVGGERDLHERQLTHLEGWKESKPVRTGNDAAGQVQLDVYGSLLDAAYTLASQLNGIDAPTRDFLVAAVDTAAQRWEDDDQGIWEMRGPPRPFLHGKVMCWVALDRGVRMKELLQPELEQLARWIEVREEIRTTILRRGWNEAVGAFTQSFGSPTLDASALTTAIVGLLPPDDMRLRSTIDTIETNLSDKQGLIYRYQGDDGLEGQEGTFLLCTFWLAQALAITGQVDRARTVLDRAASFATDLGLFSEQVDADTGGLLGNFPQAFSHLGLVTAAQALAVATGHRQAND
jgi:GH15 family glucan-1,4-alpha-glucosidase